MIEIGSTMAVRPHLPPTPEPHKYTHIQVSFALQSMDLRGRAAPHSTAAEPGGVKGDIT